MSRVYVTRKIPDAGIKALTSQGIRVGIYPKDRVIPRGTLLKNVKGCDAILSLLTDTIDAGVFDAAGSQLKIVANYAVGFDNVDVREAHKRGIIVTNTPGDEIAETVAEHTIAFLFALAHRLVEADRYVTAGKYTGWGPRLLLGMDVIGKTLGIIGSGRIGTFLVRRLATGFGMKILYHDVSRNRELETTYGAQFRSKEKLLQESDFVSLHVPLLPATHHLMSSREFSLMKQTAFLINTARGPIVDEKALVRALKTKKIAGAALDVFECEPLIACDPRDIAYLRHAPNVILTPHTASATIETRQAMSLRAAKNILAVLSGNAPLNPAQR